MSSRRVSIWNVRVSIDASIARPELRQGSKQQRRWDFEPLGGGGLAGRELFLLVIVADQILIGLETHGMLTQVRPAEVPRYLSHAACSPLQAPPRREAPPSGMAGTLGALGTAKTSTPPHARM